jgi:hypothetical protein
MRSGIEVHRATRDFQVDGRAFEAGDYVVGLDQPKGNLARALLSEQHYPDNEVTREDDGTIVPGTPYDMAQFAFAEHWGVEATPVESPLAVPRELLAEAPWPDGEVTAPAGGASPAGWITDRRSVEVYHLVNDLTAQGAELHVIPQGHREDDEVWGPGSIWIPAGAVEAPRVEELAGELGLRLRGLASAPSGAEPLRAPRIGLYRRYMGGNMDEGWTRYLFDHYGFDYARLEADSVRAGALDRMNVFVVPHDGMEALTGSGDATPEAHPGDYPESFVPPEYREGLDEAALERLRGWVRGGGTLVLLGDAWELAAEAMEVPVSDVTAGLPDTAFYSPGSTLRATFDTSHPLAWGMPEEGLVLNWDSPAFGIRRSNFNARIRSPVRYAESDLLKSGWLLGEHRIAGLPAAAVAEYGEGRIVMIGFRSQMRAQTGGTFKIFFNSLYPWGTASTQE